MRLAMLALAFPTAFIVPEPGDIIVPPQAIAQVICVAPDKNPALIDVTMGTAFRVGSFYLSVNHVTSARGRCAIDGKLIHIAYKSPTSDFSMLEADTGPFLKIDCGGFVDGRKYVALGFARGIPKITQIELNGTPRSDGGMAVLTGMLSVIPGMSGGAILDAETGAAVGTVNEEDFEEGVSLSVPLKDTPVCRRA